MFSDTPAMSLAARDLVPGRHEMEPEKKPIGYVKYSAETKQNPFFEGVNWSLVRSSTPS